MSSSIAEAAAPSAVEPGPAVGDALSDVEPGPDLPLSDRNVDPRIAAGTLGKIGQDVAILAQNEISEVKLAGEGVSSAMAHKSNPVGAEILVTLARFNSALLAAQHQSAHS